MPAGSNLLKFSFEKYLSSIYIGSLCENIMPLIYVCILEFIALHSVWPYRVSEYAIHSILSVASSLVSSCHKFLFYISHVSYALFVTNSSNKDWDFRVNDQLLNQQIVPHELWIAVTPLELQWTVKVLLVLMFFWVFFPSQFGWMGFPF